MNLKSEHNSNRMSEPQFLAAVVETIEVVWGIRMQQRSGSARRQPHNARFHPSRQILAQQRLRNVYLVCLEQI